MKAKFLLIFLLLHLWNGFDPYSARASCQKILTLDKISTVPSDQEEIWNLLRAKDKLIAEGQFINCETFSKGLCLPLSMTNALQAIFAAEGKIFNDPSLLYLHLLSPQFFQHYQQEHEIAVLKKLSEILTDFGTGTYQLNISGVGKIPDHLPIDPIKSFDLKLLKPSPFEQKILTVRMFENNNEYQDTLHTLVIKDIQGTILEVIEPVLPHVSFKLEIKNFVKTFGLSLPKFFRTQENETTNGFIPISILTIKKKG